MMIVSVIDCDAQQQSYENTEQSGTTAAVAVRHIINPYLSEREKVELKQIFDSARNGIAQVSDSIHN